MIESGERVLVRVPSWLGDLVAAEPLLRALARRHPPELLTLAGPGALLSLLDGQLPGARRAALEPGRRARPADWHGHDVALLLTGSWRSAWCAWRAGIPRRVGYARDGRGWLLTDGVVPARERGGVPFGLGRQGRWPRWLPRPFGATCAELAALLGVRVSDPRPRLVPGDGERERVAARLAGLGLVAGESYLVANVGSRPGSAKAYPRWPEVLDGLAARDERPVVLVCGPGEEAALARVAGELKAARALAWIDPVADLRELVALCAGAGLVLTADSGPRHVALAAGAPVVVAMGPSDPRHTAQPLERTRVVREPVACGPCHLERCPLTGAEIHRCMTGIEPARLVAAALELSG